MLGASTTAFATPFALAYALHAQRRGGSRFLAWTALVLASLEAVGCLALAAGWLWNILS